MGLFKKKFDIEENRLRIEFNSSEKIYVTYYGNTLIPYSKLTRKSKKYIESKNNDLKTNTALLEYELEKAAIKKRLEKLKALKFTCDSFEYLGPVEGTMSKQIESLLNKLVSEEDVLLGIHRIGTDDSPDKIEDILKNGLKITGHRDGAVQSNKVLKNNVGYYEDNKIIIKELMYADLYKDSKGSILIRIPDIDLEQNIFIIDSNGMPRLNPKYIVGYIPISANHHLETIITLETITKSNYKYNYVFQNTTTQNEYYPKKQKQK